MKVLIDINHPAHVHFFKNLYWVLKERGHEVVVTASKKEITYLLLDKYNIPFVDLGSYGNKPYQKALNVPLMAIKMFFVMLRERPDVAVGIASSRITHGALPFPKIKTYVFTDTEHAKRIISLFKPFATKIITPECFLDDLGPNQVRFNGYHELAYLHPRYFQPDVNVLDELRLEKNERFFVLRFVSWAASHDIGQRGFTLEGKRKIVKLLSSHGKVIISSEKKLPKEFEKYRMSLSPEKMHDLLAYADLYVGEGGTMASEAAILGTPAVGVSTLVIAGTFRELEEKYGLMFRFKDEDRAICKVEELLDSNELKATWKKRRNKMLKDKVDVTKWMLDFILKR